jgi:AcrR family transcriptional regulator
VEGTVRSFLEEAARQFGAHGYFGVSLREIAAPIGVKPSALYFHFPSKHALLYELVRIAHEHFYRTLADARDSAPKDDAAAALRAVVTAHVAFHATYSLIGMVANQEIRALSPEAAAKIVDIRRDCQDLLEQIIVDGNKSGTFDCPSPPYAMRAIGSMCLRVAAWFDPAEDSVDEVAALFADFAADMVRARR